MLVEHFIPYSAEVLLENKFISEELYDLLCDVTIGNLSKLFESEKVTSDPMNTDWINVDGSYEKNCLFDCIADFKAVMGLSDENLSENDKINLGLLTECVKIMFWLFKIDISIMILLNFSNIFDDSEKIKTDVDVNVINL